MKYKKEKEEKALFYQRLIGVAAIYHTDPNNEYFKNKNKEYMDGVKNLTKALIERGAFKDEI